MSIWLIITIVYLLYLRTLNYHYSIDDIVKRDGYLKEHPRETCPVDFCKTRPSRIYRLFVITMHAVNVFIVYKLFGWCPALLFAVHPMGVYGVAWITGNYYATTAYFVLIAYYLIHSFPVWGTLSAVPIFVAALNSTIGAVMFPFFLAASGYYWQALIMFIPLVIYLKGKRFQGGIKERMQYIPEICQGFTVRRPILMTKVMARYIHKAMLPYRLTMFNPFGKGMNHPNVYRKYHTADDEFWGSFGLCLALFICGMFIHPVGTLWFFTFMILHSQWNLFGQFFAERYLYLPIIGLCAVFGTVLQFHPFVLAFVVAALIIKTIEFTPVWRDVEFLVDNDVRYYPNFSLALNNMSGWYIKNNRLHPSDQSLSLGWLLRAEALDPRCWEVQVNLSHWYNEARDIKKMIYHTNQAIDIIERFQGNIRFDGEMETLLKQRDAALKILHEEEEKLKQKESGCAVY